MNAYVCLASGMLVHDGGAVLGLCHLLLCECDWTSNLLLSIIRAGIIYRIILKMQGRCKKGPCNPRTAWCQIQGSLGVIQGSSILPIKSKDRLV